MFFGFNNLLTQLVYLIYTEGFSVAESAELRLAAQQFGLYFCTHRGQKVTQISHSGQGELWKRQLQQAGWKRADTFEILPDL